MSVKRMVRLHAGAPSANTCPGRKEQKKKKKRDDLAAILRIFFTRRKPALRASATRARVIRMHNTHNETLIRLTTLTHGLSNRANIRSPICGARIKLERRDTDRLITCRDINIEKTFYISVFYLLLVLETNIDTPTVRKKCR